MTETDISEDKVGGIAILPKTDKRPIAIVGMGSSGVHLKMLSDRLKSVGMERTVLSLEDAKKEGITEEDLLSAQLEQKQAEGLLSPSAVFRETDTGTALKRGGGSKAQQKFKRKKKGKKTHRKKR